GSQSSVAMSPVIAFSRDSRYIAVSGGDNSVSVWEVPSGRELPTLAGNQGTMMAAFGVYFLAFTPDNRLVTISDAIKVWDINSGRELVNVPSSQQAFANFNGSDSGLVITPDGTQLAVIADVNDEIKFIDLSS